MNDLKPNWAPTELDNAATNVIGDIAKEFQEASTADAISKIDSQLGIETQGAEVQPESAGDTAVPEAQSNTGHPIQDGLDRLVAREVEIRTREESLKQREQEYQTLQTKVRELESKQVPSDFLNQLGVSPMNALKAIGVDAEDLARMIIAEKMLNDGKQPPPDLVQKIRDNKTQQELQALRRTIEMQNKQEAARSYYNQISNEAMTYIKGAEFSKDVPLLSQLSAAGNSQRIHEEIMSELVRDAQTKAQKDPSGKLLDYGEAAKLVEKRWLEYQKLLAPKTDTKQSTPQAKTSVSGTAVKPPDKPLAPWLQRGNVMEDGVKAGLMEFRRLESKP